MTIYRIRFFSISLLILVSSACSSNIFKTSFANLDSYKQIPEIEWEKRVQYLTLIDGVILLPSVPVAKSNESCRNGYIKELSIFNDKEIEIDSSSIVAITDNNQIIKLSSLTSYIGTWEYGMKKQIIVSSKNENIINVPVSLTKIDMKNFVNNTTNLDLSKLDANRNELQLVFEDAFSCPENYYSISFNYRLSNIDDFTKVIIYFSPTVYRYISK